MFHTLADQLISKFRSANTGESDHIIAGKVFQYHPLVLTSFLEDAWNSGRNRPNGFRNSPIEGIPAPFMLPRSQNPIYSDLCLQDGVTFTKDGYTAPSYCNLQKFMDWNHLIYAYMIENTGILEIFRNVIFEFTHGETLGTFSELESAAHQWIRASEELFFRDTSPFYITSLTSEVRPQLRSVRRNAYYRMFGMDLNHGTDAKTPYPYHKAEASNNEFVPAFVELLREVWIGLMNTNNKSGPNPTDEGKIFYLVQKLQDMLTLRRQGGNLTREEFSAVAAMSWFHLTIHYNSPIVSALKATATSPGERLRKLRERARFPMPASKADNMLEMAEPLSRILIAIESGFFDQGNVKLMYIADGIDNYFSNDMKIIINHWSLATGADLKATKVKLT
ncbi:hypothetical protein A8990_10920 [Paenibacillus taihuensis]|uniref:Uncharacterized protein n=1 Tax=Paenibacillus taihuensis TaxID=1156355 RepID=A0A3D9S3K5_9BACL|nr:hypothetical protein [Paenibacillus taihuensis]REE87375.1 hypothetical protein A8990_10920 [Paenibacillus taihuensis]